MNKKNDVALKSYSLDALVNSTAEKLNNKVSKKLIKEIVQAFISSCIDALADKSGLRKVRLHGLCTLFVKMSPKRLIRNPQTGKPMEIPAKNRLRVTVSEFLDRMINGDK